METIVFLHGFGSNSQSFDALREQLQEHWGDAKGVEFYAPNFAGFGERADEDLYGSPMDVAIEDVMRNLKQREHVSIIAHSMGGIVALPVAAMLAEHYPDKLKKVALIEGNLVAEDCGDIARGFRDTEDFSALITAKNKLISIASGSENVGLRNWSDSLKRTKPETLKAYAGPLIARSESGVLLETFKSLADSGVDIRYIHGDGKLGHAATDALDGYNVVYIADAGHFAHEDQPEAVAKTILGMG